MPEVQALAERIEARLDGACLVRATALSFSALKTVSPPPDELEGRPLRPVGGSSSSSRWTVFAC